MSESQDEDKACVAIALVQPWLPHAENRRSDAAIPYANATPSKVSGEKGLILSGAGHRIAELVGTISQMPLMRSSGSES
jgi:hypothetical protein